MRLMIVPKQEERRALCASYSPKDGKKEGSLRHIIPVLTKGGRTVCATLSLFSPKEGGLYAPHVPLFSPWWEGSLRLMWGIPRVCNRCTS